ncbi:DNA recombination protein RmuC [Kordiimonas sediminis]|uniref:DNA recombination protein RmuC n=1 Tax=Kordiimonas sediminis TaxID=1735581 RepID=UPI00174BD9C1|nr:DNA recombination protein RmuC [Kordiimonas sediminis]
MTDVSIELFYLAFLVLFSLVIFLLFQVLKRQKITQERLQAEDTTQNFVRLDTRMITLAENLDKREQAIRHEFQLNRQETNEALTMLAETVRKLGKEHAADQQQFRDKLDEKMREIREENSKKLDEMRQTVDEKLQTTLEKRISESFKTVSERLEAVQRGLGEMQTLATGVGDLKRVLTNVKSRGTFGETQLNLLIADMLTADQYVANYDCGHVSGNARVEFGIRVPGTEKDVFLPVDAKFPTEDYERLLGAVEIGDVQGVDAASKSLIRSVKGFAKDISSKYINPPHTTDWAILFLPTEGLYAEVLRQPGVFEELQRDYRVTIAGPTNFQVLLSTFRMGFRQVVLQERANEVWEILGAVKNEFENFGSQINAMAKNLEAAKNHVDKLDVRKRAMLRALKNVEKIEDTKAGEILELSMDE